MVQAAERIILPDQAESLLVGQAVATAVQLLLEDPVRFDEVRNQLLLAVVQ
jgi:hypothetical protein